MKKIDQLRFFKQANSLAKIREELAIISADRLSRFALWLSFFLLCIVFLVVFILWSKLPPQIPLFYSRPWGEEQLASNYWLLILPFSLLGLLIFNLTLSSLFKKELLLSKILLWTPVILILLATITIFKILFLIF